MVSLGVISYLTTPTYLFDGAIVIASIVLEFVMETRHHHDTGILVFARAWRFVTLINSMKAIQEDKVNHIFTTSEEEEEEEARRRKRVGGDDGNGEG